MTIKTAFLFCSGLWALGIAWGLLVPKALPPIRRQPANFTAATPPEASQQPTTPQQQQPPTPTTAVVTKASLNEVDFEVKSVTAQGATLTVELTALNRGADRNLDIFRDKFRSVTLYDDHGSTWQPDQMRIGNKTNGDFAMVRALLIAGVPTPVVFTFTVPTAAGRSHLTRIARLEVPLVIGGANDFFYGSMYYGSPFEPPGLQRVVFHNLTSAPPY